MANGTSWPTVGDLEFEFLLDVLASRLFPERPFPDPPNNLDWERLFRILQQNRLAAYFYSFGKRILTCWPTSFRSELRQEHYRYLIYGDQCAVQVRKCLAALRYSGINVIVLKGWAFIHTLYGGDTSQRFCEDIDILVHPENAQAAEEILQEIGFQGTEEYWPGYRRRYRNARAFISLKQLGSFGDMFSIGLHWGLLQIPAYSSHFIDNRSLFESARQIRVEGVDVLELAAEDEIVYACAHDWLHHRNDSVLLRYFEIAALVMKSYQTLNWEMVLKRARAWKVVLPMQNILLTTDHLWPDIIPSLARKQLMDVKPTTSEYFIDRWITLTKSKLAYTQILHWVTLPGIYNRFRYVYENIIPSPDYMRLHYGEEPSGVWSRLYLKRFTHFFLYLLEKIYQKLRSHV